MISFTINLELISKLRAQRNETSRGWYGMQIRDATLVKTNGCKMTS